MKENSIIGIVAGLLAVVLLVILSLLYDFVFGFNFVIGIPLVFFVPGFLMQRLLFNGSKKDVVEATVLSVLLSVFVMPFIFYVLYSAGFPFGQVMIYGGSVVVVLILFVISAFLKKRQK